MGKCVEVEFCEFKRLSGRIDSAVKKDLPKFTKDMTGEIADCFLADVKANTPCETGKLREAWRVEGAIETFNGYQMDVFNDTEYASHVEYGHMQKIGMFVPAIGKTIVKGWVFGKYMMAKAIQSTQKKIGVIVKPKLDSFVKGVFYE